MVLPRSLVVCTLMVLVLVSSVTGAQAQAITGDKHPEPVTRAQSHLRVALPCDQAVQDFMLDPNLTYAYIDSTEGASAADTYACESWDESGPEHIYLLEVTSVLTVDIWLAGNDPNDHDLVLLSACDTDSCLFQANTQISAELLPGNYVLVVDGYDGAAGPYELTFETRSAGIPEAICEPGGHDDLGEFLGGESDERNGDLFGQPNQVSVDDCSTFPMRGGEIWYALELAAADTTFDDDTDIGSVRISLHVIPLAENLDLGLWIYDRCGPDAVCLDFADINPAGVEESLTFHNTEPEPVTIYVAVDCANPADEDLGRFQLTTGAELPVKARSLSDIRDLFR